MATVNPSSSGERLRELLPRLREADDRLNEALERIEDLFETELPEGSYGCMLLSYSHGTWTHLLYYDAILWIETWVWSKKSWCGFHCEDAVNHDIRANKLEACRRMKDMWVLCGGDPERVGRKSDDPIGID
jgi:hypothetical protein